MADQDVTRTRILTSRGWSIVATVATVAMVFLLGILGVSGCSILFTSGGPVEELSPDMGLDNAYACNCVCQGSGQQITPQVTACYPAALNPALGGTAPDPAELEAALALDCRQRVELNLIQLSKACVASSIDCVCDAPGSTTFAAECNNPCVEEVLDPQCSNFDPEAGIKTATNTFGNPPVCLVASSDPPVPVPDPLVAGIYGRTSRCEVTGTVTIMSGDNAQARSASGVVEFTGGPCPGASCDVGMAYRIDHVNTFEFESFLGFGTVELENIRAVGASTPGAVTLDPSGRGTVPAVSTLGSGKGKRINDGLLVSRSEKEAAYFGTNSDPLDVDVLWTARECAVNGVLFGTFDDADTTLVVDLAGTLVNQPPTADAGPAAEVECTSPDGSAITLDGQGSTDPDDNIAMFVWRRESRAGTEVGSGPVIALEQAIGGTSYFLKVVDTFGQSSAASKLVRVVDTTSPVLTGVEAIPNVLFPPNHKMVPVTVDAAASDVCGPTTCRITGVSSNEPVNAPGDGNTIPDWEITGDRTVALRAERSGKGVDRIYTVTVQCTDDAGNSSTATTAVIVPHD